MKTSKFTRFLSALSHTSHVAFLKLTYILFIIISVIVTISTVWQRTNIGPFYTIVLSIPIALLLLTFIYLLDNRIDRNNFEHIGNNCKNIAIVACILGLIVRISFVLSFPIFQYSDAFNYWHLAQQIASNADYVTHTSTGVALYAWRPPGLPLLLAAPIAIFGPQPWIPPAMNLALYVAGCFVAYRVGRILVGSVGGLGAVVLLAAYPGNIAIGPLALTEPAALVLLLGGFWAILRWGRWPAAVAVGVTLGYSALVKPTFLVLVVVLAAFALLSLSDDHKVEGHRRAWWCLAAIVIFILVQAPWVYRNYERLGTLVIGSTLGGLNFYMANNPGTLTGTTGLDPLSSYSNELDRSKIGYARGIEWIRENPLDFAIVATKRLLRFAGRTSVQMNVSVQEKCQCDGRYYRVLSWLDTIWWYLCWILAIYAVWKHRIVYSRKPWAAMLFMMIAFLFPVHSVYIGVGRHHEPIAGLILLVAATALSSTFTQRHITAQAQQRDP